MHALSFWHTAVRPKFLDSGPNGRWVSGDKFARRTSASSVLTSWTADNVALVEQAVLSGLVGWPLFVTPLATKVEPTGTLSRLKLSSGSSARCSVNRSA